MADKTIPVLKVLRGNVGIGMNAPLAPIDLQYVYNSAYTSANSNTANPQSVGFRIHNNTATASSSASLLFMVGNSSSGRASINCVWRGSALSDLAFGSGTTGGAVNEGMRLTSEGNLGIGTTAPGHPLVVVGSADKGISITNSSNVELIQMRQEAGDKGAIFLKDGGNVKVLFTARPSNNSYFNVNGANFGVGTSTPTRVLQVNGAAHATSHLVGSLTTALGIAGSFPDANDSELGPGYLVMTRDDTAAAKQLQFWKNGSLHSGLMTDTNGLNFVGSDGAADVTIKTDGKVGVGVTSPIRGLDLSLSVPGQYAAALINTSTTGHGVYIKGGPNHVSYMSLAVERQDGSTNFVARGDGNFGIGTNAPGGILSIGSSNESYFSSNAPNTLNFFYNTNSDTGGWINYRGYQDGTTQTRDLIIGDGKGNKVATFDGSTKRVGIGTDVPSTKLQVNDTSDSRLLIYETGASPYTATLELASQAVGTYGALIQYTSGAERLTIQNYGRTASNNSNMGGIAFKTKLNNTTPTEVMSIHGFSGNVGIGDITPSYKLDVNGTFRVTGAATFDSSIGFATVLAGNGTASLPSFAFTNDPNTGMYNDGANDNLKFSTGGVVRAFLTATQWNVSGNIVGVAGIFSGAVSGTTATFTDVMNLSGVNKIHQLSGHNFVQGDATMTYLYGGSGGGQIRTTNNASSLVQWLDNGNVGIGTTSPSSQFHVYDGTAVDAFKVENYNRGAVWNSVGAGGMYSEYQLTGTWKFRLGQANHLVSGASVNNFALSYAGDLLFSSSVTERMRITSTGKVGIGRTDPSTKLVVNGIFDASATPSVSAPAANSANKGILITREAASGWGTGYTYGIDFAVSNSINAASQYKVAAIYGAVESVPYYIAGKLGFYTTTGGNGALLEERMTIKASGSVGIGTTAPDEKLEIYDGYLKITDAVPTMVFERQSDALKGYITSNVGYFQFSYNTKDGDGYIKMDVNTSGGSAITHEGNGYLRLGANSVSNQLVLAANGKVGIGTGTPTATLHVSDSGTTDADGYSLAKSDADAQSLRTYHNGTNWVIAPKYGTQGGLSDLHLQASTGNTAGLLINRSTGNVGIGTTTPEATLTLAGPSGTHAIFRTNEATASQRAGGGFSSAGNATAASRYARMFLDPDGGDFSGVDYFTIEKFGGGHDNPGGEVKLINYSDSNMSFWVNTSVRAMTIEEGDGNVGIGTTDPGQKLHVNGNILVNAQILTPGGSNLQLNPNTGLVTVGGALTATGNITGGAFGPIVFTSSTQSIKWPNTSGQSASRSWGWIGEQGAYGYFQLYRSDASDGTLDTEVMRFRNTGNAEFRNEVTIDGNFNFNGNGTFGTGANGAGNSGSIPAVSHYVRGYSVQYDTGGSGARLTNTGFLTWWTGAGWTSNERMWSLTNAYNISGGTGRFALLRGDNNTRIPTLGNSGGLGTGTTAVQWWDKDNNSYLAGGMSVASSITLTSGSALNATSITTTTCKNLGVKLSYTGGSNTASHIIGGIAMGNSGEEYAGMYAIDGGSGARTKLALFSGSNTNGIKVGMVIEGLYGYVGIGTAAPGDLLHIYGTRPTIRLQGGSGLWMMRSDDNQSHRFEIIDANGGYDKFAIYPGNTGAIVLHSDGAGCVGIGTVTPEGTLHVCKASAAGLGGQIVIDNPASSNVNNKTELSFLTDGGASGTNIRNARIVVATETASNGAANMQFHTWNGGAEGERMRISAAGTATFSGHVLPGADGTYNLGSTSSQDWKELYIREIDMYNQRLRIYTSAEKVIFRDHTSIGQGITFQARGTQVMTIGDASGNKRVGIGTTAPSAVLDVRNGTVTQNAIYAQSDSSYGSPLYLNDVRSDTSMEFLAQFKRNNVLVGHIASDATQLRIGAPAGYVILDGADGTILRDSGSNKIIQNGSYFRPDGNNNMYLGASAQRWAQVYSVLGNFSGALTGTSAAFSHTVDPGTTPTALSVVLPGVSAGTATNQYAIKVTANGYNNSSNVYGVHSTVPQQNVNGAYALYGETSGVYANVYGLYTKATQSNLNGGCIAYGIYALATSGVDSSTVGKTYGAVISNTASVGARAVGLYVNSTNGEPLIVDSGAAQTRLIVKNNGSVGIGTDTPASLLHVYGAAQVNTFTVTGTAANLPFLVTTTNGSDIGQFRSSLTTYARLRVDCSNPGDAQVSFLSNQSTKWSIGNDAGDSHKFKIATGFGAFSGAETFMIQTDGNIGIGTNTAGYKFHVQGDILASGAIMGNSKSFVIDHPTKPNHKLQYGALEGPEFGVYHRGRAQSDTITLPDYWSGLVRDGTVTVQLTPNGSFQHLYVVSTSLSEIKIGAAEGETIDCYYTIYGERADLDPLVVEKIV